jgi:hypothetical protein
MHNAEVDNESIKFPFNSTIPQNTSLREAPGPNGSSGSMEEALRHYKTLSQTAKDRKKTHRY